jgi:hypothetical protein
MTFKIDGKYIAECTHSVIHQVKLEKTVGIYGQDYEGNHWTTFQIINGDTTCHDCGVVIDRGWECGFTNEATYSVCSHHVQLVDSFAQESAWYRIDLVNSAGLTELISQGLDAEQAVTYIATLLHELQTLPPGARIKINYESETDELTGRGVAKLGEGSVS